MISVTCRLDDLILMTQQGKKVELSDVSLYKMPIIVKVHPDAGITEEQDAFLFNAEFHFQVDGEPYDVSKTYATGLHTASVEVIRGIRNIANARLRRDYDRLTKAGILVEKKNFE